MAKRYTDSNKYKSSFIRGLPGAYKLFWDYLYHDCDHAGVWIVDFDIAQVCLGLDFQISKRKAFELFNKHEIRVISFDFNKKWFLPTFVAFQYGELKENNKVHKSVLNTLEKYDLKEFIKKTLPSPYQGSKDKDKEILGGVGGIPQEFETPFLMWLKYKRARRETYKDSNSILLAYKKLLRLSNKSPEVAILIIEQSMENNWAGMFELKENPNVKKENIREDGITYKYCKDGKYRNAAGEIL